MGNNPIPTPMGMTYDEIQKLDGTRPYEFETDREQKWYEIGLIDGAEAADLKAEAVKEEDFEAFIHLTIGEVVCHETDVARQLEQGKSFAEHNKAVYDVALAVAKSYDEQLQLRMDAYAREYKALSDNEKLRERNDALKRQLDESKLQIELYAKKVKWLETELNEYCLPTRSASSAYGYGLN